MRSAVRTAVAKARRSVLQLAPEGTEEMVRVATSALDKAAEHGVLHKRNASRRKSRLMKLAARASAEQAAPPAEAAPKRKVATRAPKSAAGTKKAAPAKSRTKTERTAARTRRTTGSSGQERG